LYEVLYARSLIRKSVLKIQETEIVIWFAESSDRHRHGYILRQETLRA